MLWNNSRKRVYILWNNSRNSRLKHAREVQRKGKITYLPIYDVMFFRKSDNDTPVIIPKIELAQH